MSKPPTKLTYEQQERRDDMKQAGIAVVAVIVGFALLCAAIIAIYQIPAL